MAAGSCAASRDLLRHFSADGRTILVGNMVEKDLQVFEWDGAQLRDTGHRIKVNGGPAAIRTAER
jgi:hypothetical protein